MVARFLEMMGREDEWQEEVRLMLPFSSSKVEENLNYFQALLRKKEMHFTSKLDVVVWTVTWNVNA